METQNQTAKHGQLRINRIKDVCATTGLSRTTIWRKVQDGSFPVPVKLGANAIGWYAHEIEEWLNALPRTYLNTPNAH